jgi:hypothetical protein
MENQVTLLAIVQRNKCNTHPKPLMSTPFILKIWETKMSSINRDCDRTLMHHAIKIAPTYFQTQHLVSCCQSWSNVTSPRQWRLKHYLTLVHLHVSLTRSLVWQLKLPLVKKITPMAVEVIDGPNLSSSPMMHETKELELPLGHIQAKLFSMSFPP